LGTRSCVRARPDMGLLVYFAMEAASALRFLEYAVADGMFEI